MAQIKTQKKPNEALNPVRFVSAIRRRPEFQDALPRESIGDLTTEQMRAARISAVGQGATALAIEREESHGAYDLDANLFSLIGNASDFFEAHEAMEYFHDTYDRTPRHLIDQDEVDTFRANKQTVIKFNGILKEVMNAGAAKFNFAELLEFITNQYTSIQAADNVKFQEAIRQRMVGIRDELAVEQILIENGIDFELGSEEDEEVGGDFIINDVRIDIKSSQHAAVRAKQIASAHDDDPDRFIWSQIESKDYRGKLTLPPSATKRVAENLIPLINTAANTNYQLAA